MKVCRTLLKVFYLFLFLIPMVSCSYNKKLTAVNIELKPYLSSYMVFNYGDSIRLGGTCNPEGILAVRLNSDVKIVKADKSGKWKVNLPTIDYKREFAIHIDGKKKSLTLNHLQMGEVWVVIGDTWIKESEEFLLNDNAERVRMPNTRVRIFTPNSLLKKNDDPVEWRPLNTYKTEYREQFAQILGDELIHTSNRPIGIINLSWPGTDFSSVSFLDTLDVAKKDSLWDDFFLKQKEYAHLADSSFIGLEKGVLSRYEDDWDWREISFPVVTRNNWYLKNRIVWFRKKINIAEKFINSDFTLNLGPVKGQFDVYFNGIHLDKLKGENRNYTLTIPDSLIKVWTNMLTIRMVAGDLSSGMFSETPSIYNADSSYSSSLKEKWLVRNYFEPILPSIERPVQLTPLVFDEYISLFKNYNVRGVIVGGGINQYKNATSSEIEEGLKQINAAFKSEKKYIFILSNPNYFDSLISDSDYQKSRTNQLIAAGKNQWDLVNTLDLPHKSFRELQELMGHRFIETYLNQ